MHCIAGSIQIKQVWEFEQMKIFVTRAIPQAGLELLQKEYQVEVNPFDRVLSKEEIIKGLRGKDGLLCLLTDVIDKEVLTS